MAVKREKFQENKRYDLKTKSKRKYHISEKKNDTARVP